MDIGLLVSSNERAAMNQDERRKRPVSLRDERIEREADVARFGEFDIGLQTRRRGLSRDNAIDGRRQADDQDSDRHLNFIGFLSVVVLSQLVAKLA